MTYQVCLGCDSVSCPDCQSNDTTEAAAFGLPELTADIVHVNYKFLDDMTGTVILPLNELGLVVA
jgi:hypothetical protein